MTERAIFLDRDGTLVHACHFPSRPEQMRLFDGVVAQLLRLKAAGWRLIVVTNQSGIARGYFTEETLDHIHQRLPDDLEAHGAGIDSIYVCPHHPDGVVSTLAVSCECRKPEPGMLIQAAEDFELERSRCWFVGDILDDIEAGRRAGCRTVLVDGGTEQRPEQSFRQPHFIGRDTVHALRIIQAVEGIGPAVEIGYRPARWKRPLNPQSKTAARRAPNHAKSD